MFHVKHQKKETAFYYFNNYSFTWNIRTFLPFYNIDKKRDNNLYLI